MTLPHPSLFATLLGLARRIGPQFVASVMATLCAAALTPMLLSRPAENAKDGWVSVPSPASTASIPDRVPAKLSSASRSEEPGVLRRLPIFASNAAFVTWEAAPPERAVFDKTVDPAPPVTVVQQPAAPAMKSARAPSAEPRERSVTPPSAAAGAPLDLLILKGATAKEPPEQAGIVGRILRSAGDMSSWAGGKVVGLLWP